MSTGAGTTASTGTGGGTGAIGGADMETILKNMVQEALRKQTDNKKIKQRDTGETCKDLKEGHCKYGFSGS